MELKIATKEDINLVMEGRIAMVKAVNQLPEDTTFDEEFLTQSRNYFLKADQTTVLAVEHNTVIGCATLCYIRMMPTFDHPTGQRAHLMNVYTEESHRHQGIAYQMMELLLAKAKQRGVTEISLDATEDGRPLYLKCGFKDSEDGMVLTI